MYEVGVHIADVSYFLESGTPLDTMASNRATSVYLIQRVCVCVCLCVCICIHMCVCLCLYLYLYIQLYMHMCVCLYMHSYVCICIYIVLLQVIPMLPRRLCEDLCSLNPNEVQIIIIYY